MFLAILEEIQEQYKQLCVMEERILAQKEEFQDGRLRINRNGNVNQYYYCNKENGNRGKYIPRNQMKFVYTLAQSDYYKMALEEIQTQKILLEQMIQGYHPHGIMEIYENYHPHRKLLVDPIIVPDEQYVRQWQSEEYKRNGFDINNDSSIYTNKGERVRSKTEKIIADRLKDLNIPYKYEKPLYLQNPGKWIYPDFNVLNVRLRKEYYFEHFGKMLDEEYCKRNLRKIENYERNGYFLGDKLIATFEAKDMQIDTAVLDMVIQKYFL